MLKIKNFLERESTQWMGKLDNMKFHNEQPSGAFNNAHRAEACVLVVLKWAGSAGWGSRTEHKKGITRSWQVLTPAASLTTFTLYPLEPFAHNCWKKATFHFVKSKKYFILCLSKEYADTNFEILSLHQHDKSKIFLVFMMRFLWLLLQRNVPL